MNNAFASKNISAAVKKFETPFYLYHEEAITNRYQTIRNKLDSSCAIYYSMKANPNVSICHLFQKSGSGCEVSSGNELLTAMAAGFLPKDIIFVGPAKKQFELVLCVEKSIRYIVCESIDEIFAINTVSRKNKTITPILIRLNPDFKMNSAPLRMSGVASQFGITTEVLSKSLPEILRLKNVVLEGFHIYNASRVLSENAIIENIHNILTYMISLQNKYKIAIKVIDFGGGFGVPYFGDESEIDINAIILNINKLIKDYRHTYCETQFILELGRYLISEFGCLVSSIVSIKESHDKKYVITDGGMHCHLGASSVGSYLHRNFPMEHVTLNKKSLRADKDLYQVTGCLCTPGDVVLRDVYLSNPQVNDFIVLKNTGAYGLTASPSRFLSHGAPAEVMMAKNRMMLIRRKETVDDFLHTQQLKGDIKC